MKTWYSAQEFVIFFCLEDISIFGKTLTFNTQNIFPLFYFAFFCKFIALRSKSKQFYPNQSLFQRLHRLIEIRRNEFEFF